MNKMDDETKELVKAFGEGLVEGAIPSLAALGAVFISATATNKIKSETVKYVINSTVFLATWTATFLKTYQR